MTDGDFEGNRRKYRGDHIPVVRLLSGTAALLAVLLGWLGSLIVSTLNEHEDELDDMKSLDATLEERAEAFTRRIEDLEELHPRGHTNQEEDP